MRCPSPVSRRGARFARVGITAATFWGAALGHGLASDDPGQELAGPVIHGPPAPRPPAVVARDELGRVTLRAIRLDEPLVLDGALDEQVYERVLPAGNFIQQEPLEGEPATEKTEAWVMFDERNIYVGARCWDSHPERMVVNELRRDNFNIFQNENFTVVLDTFYDRRNGYFFQTNPMGALRDQLVADEGQAINPDWNTVWNVKASYFEQGWTMEMAIPFKSLRYRAGSPQVWGINLRRVVRWKNETSFLSPVPISYSFRAIYAFSSAATLVGIEVPRHSRNLEIKPYGISSVTTNRLANPPFSNDLAGDGGLDVKYGVTKGLTADFTVNTDFAQVEEDEQQVNLTRFSLFFPEKRDFFLEGQGIFAFGGVNIRRGGRISPGDDSPQVTPVMFFSRRIGLAEGEAIPIRAGGRLTGRAGAYRIGLLNIESGDSELASEVEPTNFTVFRLRRDVFGRSDVGVIGTHRSRNVNGEGSNSLLGFDANFAFLQDLRINSYYARTRTSGLSPLGDDASSYLAEAEWGADRYGFLLQHLFVGKDFRPEIGFLRRDAFRRSYATARFSPRPESIESIRKLIWEGDLDYITDDDGEIVETRRQGAAFRIEFENSDQFAIEYKRRFEFLPDPFEISENVILPVGGYSFQDIRTIFELGPQRRVPGFLAYRQGSFFNGDRKELEHGSRVEVTPKFSIEPRVNVNWVDLVEGSFVTKLFGARVNYTATPRVLVSSLVQYNTSNDTLNASVRFRWEYEPGSDLFVVYSEGRDSDIEGFPLLTNRTFVVKLTKLFRF